MYVRQDNMSEDRIEYSPWSLRVYSSYIAVQIYFLINHEYKTLDVWIKTFVCSVRLDFISQVKMLLKIIDYVWAVPFLTEKLGETFSK